MKIIYLHQYFNTPEMSGGTRSYEMARRLVEMGHEVNMVTTFRKKTSKKGWFETVEKGIKVHWLPVRYSNHLSYFQRLKAFTHFAIMASKRAVKIDADLVFASSTPLTIAIPAIRVKKTLKIPMVFEVRDVWPYVPIGMGELRNPYFIQLAEWLEKRAYNQARYVIALSPGMKNKIREKTETPIEVIPNSSDIELFNVDKKVGEDFRIQNKWLGDRPLLVYCGTLGRVNGLGYMVDIAQKMLGVNPEIRFLIVGEGRERVEIENKARNLGVLNKNLYMIEALPKKQIPAIYSAADCTSSFVINNKVLWDNSANKFFDSLAASKPIVINHGGWQADLLNETGAGRILPPNDALQSALILDKFLSNTSELEQASHEARKLATEKFDRNILAQKLNQVLLKSVEI